MHCAAAGRPDVAVTERACSSVLLSAVVCPSIIGA